LVIISAFGSALGNSVVRKLFGDGGWLIFSAARWFHWGRCHRCVSWLSMFENTLDEDQGNIFMVSSGIHAALLMLREGHY